MKRFIILSAIFLSLVAQAAPSKVSFRGKVTDSASGEPVAGVVVSVGKDYLWAVSELDGSFNVEGMQPGRYNVTFSCLGYADFSTDIVFKTDVKDYVVRLQVSSLALKEVTVTAKRTDEIGTSHSLGRDALNHLQMSNLTDMAALLPGGKTSNPDLTQSSAFSIRSGGTAAGNAAFSTAVEVDGVRLGNNAGFGEMSGVDTRSIGVDNVESVEVMSGVPSAEYGDLGSGMVRIHTKRGRTPLNVTFSVNPRTYQASASKGIAMGENGTLNLSAEWARATRKLSSPYESYTRRGISAVYSNTIAKNLRFEFGVTGNLGGMNSEDDPDAFSGAWSKASDNVLRAHSNLNWQLNRSWITSLRLEASVNYQDNETHTHEYNSFASNQPAVHSEVLGYSLAESLPLTYFSDAIVDSRELDAAASLKYTWVRNIGEVKSNLKAGAQWKANGNTGRGEYYLDEALAANGYRPRPYSDYPFMHNVSLWAEENLTIPVGATQLDLTAGLRMENVYIQGSQYDNMHTLSPRVNARWKLGDALSIRGGWGVTEKLPSFYILYPRQEWRDIRTFAFSYSGGSSYIYFTQPFKVDFNPDLKWQRGSNAEVGVDFAFLGVKGSIVGFRNLTELPYKITSTYSPFEYNIMQLPSGYSVPGEVRVKVDPQTGQVYLRGDDDSFWTPMDTKVTDRTFVRNTHQDNGSTVVRTGAELTLEFPQIKPIRTSLRLDASYAWTSTEDRSEAYYYNYGWSHTSLANRSYQYVGIFANGSSSASLSCGKISRSLDANLTSITHIPEARLIVTCRLEVSLLKRSQNIAAGSQEMLCPVAYLDLDGVRHEWTAADASNPELEHLILKPTNDYLFDPDGYLPYASANLSVTKEIGKKVSLSFFANNFTNARPTVYSMATGVGAIFTPSFYYGLTCRIKL